MYVELFERFRTRPGLRPGSCADVVLDGLAGMNQVITDARNEGKRPAVTALARELRISYPTFWRRFPDIAQELVTLPDSESGTQPRRSLRAAADQLAVEHARLKRTNTELRCNLDLAKVAIQRLFLNHHRLRQQLMGAAKIILLDRRRQGHHTKR